MITLPSVQGGKPVFSFLNPHSRTYCTDRVLCNIASEKTLSGEKGWEHKVFLPCLLPTCCSDKFQSFLPLLNNRFLAWLVPCMVRVTVQFGFCGEYLQPRFGSCSLMKLIKTRECNIFQSAGVWGEKPFSTGDSSQFCRIHYIPESVELELCKQLVWAPGYCKA